MLKILWFLDITKSQTQITFLSLKSLLNCLLFHHILQCPIGTPQSSKFYSHATAAAAKSLQLCLTLCNPVDVSQPGSPVPGILQARILEWAAIFFSSAWKWKVKVKSLSHVWLLATPLTAAYRAPLSMGFSRQEYWSGVHSEQIIWQWKMIYL